ncbi:hypothetical protein ACQY0O_003427 [Thecaphora frezii]
MDATVAVLHCLDGPAFDVAAPTRETLGKVIHDIVDDAANAAGNAASGPFDAANQHSNLGSLQEYGFSFMPPSGVVADAYHSLDSVPPCTAPEVPYTFGHDFCVPVVEPVRHDGDLPQPTAVSYGLVSQGIVNPNEYLSVPSAPPCTAYPEDHNRFGHAGNLQPLQDVLPVPHGLNPAYPYSGPQYNDDPVIHPDVYSDGGPFPPQSSEIGQPLSSALLLPDSTRFSNPAQDHPTDLGFWQGEQRPVPHTANSLGPATAMGPREMTAREQSLIEEGTLLLSQKRLAGLSQAQTAKLKSPKQTHGWGVLGDEPIFDWVRRVYQARQARLLEQQRLGIIYRFEGHLPSDALEDRNREIGYSTRHPRRRYEPRGMLDRVVSPTDSFKVDGYTIHFIEPAKRRQRESARVCALPDAKARWRVAVGYMSKTPVGYWKEGYFKLYVEMTQGEIEHLDLPPGAKRVSLEEWPRILSSVPLHPVEMAWLGATGEMLARKRPR